MRITVENYRDSLLSYGDSSPNPPEVKRLQRELTTATIS
jgi:hypothetical protein